MSVEDDSQRGRKMSKEVALLTYQLGAIRDRIVALEGAVPMEEMADVQSGVTQLVGQRAEDKGRIDKLTEWQLKIEASVYHQGLMLKWGLGIVGAIIVAVATSVIATLVKHG